MYCRGPSYAEWDAIIRQNEETELTVPVDKSDTVGGLATVLP